MLADTTGRTGKKQLRRKVAGTVSVFTASNIRAVLQQAEVDRRRRRRQGPHAARHRHAETPQPHVGGVEQAATTRTRWRTGSNGGGETGKQAAAGQLGAAPTL